MMAELNETLQGFSSRPGTKALVRAAESKAVSAGTAVEDHLGDRVQRWKQDGSGDLFYRLNVVSIPLPPLRKGNVRELETCSGISLASLYRKLDAIAS